MTCLKYRWGILQYSLHGKGRLFKVPFPIAYVYTVHMCTVHTCIVPTMYISVCTLNVNVHTRGIYSGQPEKLLPPPCRNFSVFLRTFCFFVFYPSNSSLFFNMGERPEYIPLVNTRYLHFKLRKDGPGESFSAETLSFPCTAWCSWQDGCIQS